MHTWSDLQLNTCSVSLDPPICGLQKFRKASYSHTGKGTPADLISHKEGCPSVRHMLLLPAAVCTSREKGERREKSVRFRNAASTSRRRCACCGLLAVRPLARPISILWCLINTVVRVGPYSNTWAVTYNVHHTQTLQAPHSSFFAAACCCAVARRSGMRPLARRAS